MQCCTTGLCAVRHADQVGCEVPFPPQPHTASASDQMATPRMPTLAHAAHPGLHACRPVHKLPRLPFCSKHPADVQHATTSALDTHAHDRSVYQHGIATRGLGNLPTAQIHMMQPSCPASMRCTPNYHAQTISLVAGKSDAYVFRRVALPVHDRPSSLVTPRHLLSLQVNGMCAPCSEGPSVCPTVGMHHTPSLLVVTYTASLSCERAVELLLYCTCRC